jgi:Protein of unknown function (DUF4238)
MDSPSKHYFNPAFSLKPWAGEDDNVCQMRKVGGKVIPRRVHPNATGFERDLYRIDGVSPEQAQHVEVNFFKPLDTEAARALQKILTGDTSPWDGPTRSAWTRYILSLMFRMPTAVGALKNHIAVMWTEGIKALEADYENRRLPTDPPTFAEYFALTNPAASQIGAANMLMQIIDNDRVGPTIFNMHWFRIPLPKANVELLCSDRPIDRPLGFDDPRAYIALPVAPRLLFLAAHNEELPNAISGWSHTEIVKRMNRTVVAQAREFVWGSNDNQLGFISKHMGSAPERDLLTPEQRAEAIAAATGQRTTSCGID